LCCHLIRHRCSDHFLMEKNKKDIRDYCNRCSGHTRHGMQDRLLPRLLNGDPPLVLCI
jgi:hypothetical protein